MHFGFREACIYYQCAFIMPLLLFAKENVGYLSLPTQKENTKLLQLTKP